METYNHYQYFKSVHSLDILFQQHHVRYTTAMSSFMRILQSCPYFCLLLGFFICSPSLGSDDKTTTQSKGKDKSYLIQNFYLENDLFADTDTDYTNGVRYSLAASQTKNVGDSKLPEFLKTANLKLITTYKNLFPKNSQGAEITTRFIATFAQRMYTPEDKEPTEVIDDQRPYAGWLYLGMATHLRAERQLNTLELDLGIIGPAALGREIQDAVHDARGITKFQGWDNQLSNELGFSIILERKQKTREYQFGRGLEADIIGHWGGSLGNVATYLNAGIEFRLGWELPDDFGTSALRPGGDNSVSGSEHEGFHLFASVDTRLVARDIFLDGNTFKNSHSVTKKNVVADAAVGFSFNFHRFKVSYARIFRTKEFDLQPKYHSYGSIAISYWKRI